MERILDLASPLTGVVLLVGLLLWMRNPDSPAADVVLTTGLIVLIAAPVGRLVAALVHEIRRREWRFVLLGAVVLLLLGASVAISFGGR
jgi:hypothetical protein